MTVRAQSRESFSSTPNRLSGQHGAMMRDGEYQDWVRLLLSLACGFNGRVQHCAPALIHGLFSRWYDPDVISHQTFFAIPHPTLIVSLFPSAAWGFLSHTFFQIKGDCTCQNGPLKMPVRN
jgi:hypothetical protein